MGLFDGAANDGQCGVGVVLKTTSSHCYRGHLKVGLGTNIKTELLALWGLLNMSLHCGIISLFIFGDSKVIVDWFNGEANLNVLILQDWKNRILSLRPSFSFIKALHIHREYNSQADSLSKQGLSGQLGLLQVEEFDEGSLISAFSISLF